LNLTERTKSLQDDILRKCTLIEDIAATKPTIFSILLDSVSSFAF